MTRIGLGAAVVATLLASTLAGCKVSSDGTSSSGKNGDETSGKLLQHSQDVKIIKCATDSLGDLDAKVKVTNHSSKASDYIITIAFESKNGKKQLATGNAAVDSLQPGQSTTQDANGLKTAHGPFKCVLSDAQRTEASL